MLLSLVRTYALVFGADVHSTNSTWTYVGPHNVHYFVVYPLVNTWTNKTAFGPLCNSSRRTLGFGRCPLLFRELVIALPYKYPLPLQFSHAPRLPVDLLVGVSWGFVCFGTNGEGTLELSFQWGNVRIPNSLITSLCCSIIVFCW